MPPCSFRKHRPAILGDLAEDDDDGGARILPMFALTPRNTARHKIAIN
jgi:hypothetical protein